jgi:hypothetical protein
MQLEQRKYINNKFLITIQCESSLEFRKLIVIELGRRTRYSPANLTIQSIFIIQK